MLSELETGLKANAFKIRNDVVCFAVGNSEIPIPLIEGERQSQCARMKKIIRTLLQGMAVSVSMV